MLLPHGVGSLKVSPLHICRVDTCPTRLRKNRVGENFLFFDQKIQPWGFGADIWEIVRAYECAQAEVYGPNPLKSL